MDSGGRMDTTYKVMISRNKQNIRQNCISQITVWAILSCLLISLPILSEDSLLPFMILLICALFKYNSDKNEYVINNANFLLMILNK